MKISKSLFTHLSLGLVVVSNLSRAFAQADSAQGNAPDHAGPPFGWEAKPPIHFRPDISASPTGYSPAKIRHAYGFDLLSANGTGQKIAIVDAYGNPTMQNDLNIFCDTFGLPRTTLQFVYPQGAPHKNSGWALETALDVEWAHAIAPGAKIIVVAAKSASLSDLLGAVDAAVNAGAHVVSMSWGGSEFSSESSYNSHFNRAGVTFLASSGDSGAGVSWPAVSPFVVGVGGTKLTLDASGNVISETGWSGSGGGVSKYETRPAYQNGWQTAARRAVPDVSYVADPNTGVSVYIGNYNGASGWFTVGGTSAGAPQWAGLIAVANSSRNVFVSSLSGANSAIYSVANSNYPGNFRDIVSGSNGFSCTPFYDLVTGVGSPISEHLAPALSNY